MYSLHAERSNLDDMAEELFFHQPDLLNDRTPPARVAPLFYAHAITAGYIRSTFKTDS